MIHRKRCIVIGASAGGVEALQQVVAQLPEKLAVPVFVVLHIPPYLDSSLPEILERAGPLRAMHPRDGQPIAGGVIYVALPDHHLLIGKGRMAVKRGPKENRFRPSIDALFRSAAYIYGSGAIGVILSGALDDGTSGLWSIKRLGGIAIIQDPGEALFESMPRNALEFVKPDYLRESNHIGRLLGELVERAPLAKVLVEPKLKSLIRTEIEIAAEGGAFQKGIMKIGTFTPFTCPECHGALVKIGEGRISRFRCHTGHAYTESALLEGIMESSEKQLWQVIRSLEEAVMLLNSMGGRLRSSGDLAQSEKFHQKARETEQHAKSLQNTALAHQWLCSNPLSNPPSEEEAIAQAKS
jgi:two-component system, chemotaxis family, protein-glutamate methylesterase/glutaminase